MEEAHRSGRYRSRLRFGSSIAEANVEYVASICSSVTVMLCSIAVSRTSVGTVRDFSSTSCVGLGM